MPGNRARTVLRGPGRGNALRLPDNTASEHIIVLNEALRQIPSRFRRKILVRLDGAGASHEFIEHLTQLSTRRRKVHFTSGFPIIATDEEAIRQLPAEAWGRRSPRTAPLMSTPRSPS